MDNLARVERKAFALWLRTGRWVRAESTGDPSRKFNSNHDPANGRFTGGGSSGGGGASGNWDSPANTMKPTAHGQARMLPRQDAITAAPAAKPAAQRPPAKPDLRHVVSNGYDYAIDAQDRTRSVSGPLVLNPDAPRSRRAQREAGGPDRLPTDDGGHYIAPRFDGPTEAFNHFAQDSNFNRGRYRALEDQWATAKRAGEDVTVQIVPQFEGSSQRPSAINVWFTIDGDRKSVLFSNSSRRTRHGK